VDDNRLKKWLLISAGIHILLFIIAYVGLPQFRRPLNIPTPVPIQVVDIAELTNTRIRDSKQTPEPPKPEPPKPQQTPPPPTPQPTPPPPPKTEQPKAAPEPPKVEPKPEALKEKLPDPLKKEEPKKEPPKPPEKKPEPKKEEPKKPEPDKLANILKNVTTLKTQAPPEKEAPKKPQDKPVPTTSSQAPALSDRLTMTEEDALRQQMRQCWNMPAGARDMDQLIVEVVIDVGPDRMVRHAEIVDKSRMSRDPFFRAAAESALRAFGNPICSPLALPEGKYEQWKRITFTFDPRDML
jgi:hypothetical protein